MRHSFLPRNSAYHKKNLSRRGLSKILLSLARQTMPRWQRDGCFELVPSFCLYLSFSEGPWVFMCPLWIKLCVLPSKTTPDGCFPLTSLHFRGAIEDPAWIQQEPGPPLQIIPLARSAQDVPGLSAASSTSLSPERQRLDQHTLASE